MRENEIRASRGYKAPRAIAGRPSIIAPNRLQRELTVERPDHAWVTDITCIRTWQGWLYLAVVIDLFVRSVVGLSMKPTDTENFTRRNLTDFNLETDVVVSGRSEDPVFIGSRRYFDDAWDNADGRIYSLPIEHCKDPSWWRSFQYRFTEGSGISSY